MQNSRNAGARANKSPESIPTVSRVTPDRTIIELVYDADARKTALCVSRFGGLWNIEAEVTIETGEVLVPYSASNNLISNECVLLPSKPEEFYFKDELLADIQSFLHRYVDLSPLFEQIAAHYVLLTWVHDAFNELPYLRLQGEYGTGKTRGLLAIGSLCYRPFFASGASTVSPIFHTLDAFGGTLVLDEADLPYSDARADIVKIFNNGTVRGIPVLRTVVNKNKEFNPKAFKVFSPKLIAMRGRFEDKALESRFLTEETGSRPLRPDIPIQLPDSLKTEALTLRNRLLHYRLCHLFDIKSDPTVRVDGIEPRLNQTAVSLLSLVDDPALRKDIGEALVRENDALLSERHNTAEAKLVAAVLAVQTASPTITLKEITERYNAANSDACAKAVSNKWIGYMLRKRLKLTPKKSCGVYVLEQIEEKQLKALTHRYGLSTPHPDQS